jgi:hypothetical protein
VRGSRRKAPGTAAEARAWPDRIRPGPAACKIPGFIRSDCYKAQRPEHRGSRAVSHVVTQRDRTLRVTPGEEFAAARRLQARDGH